MVNLVRLSSEVVVSPATIEAVYIVGDPYGDRCVVVRTVSGYEYRIACRYGQSIYETHDAILRDIEVGATAREVV